jgi:hypothetical protein
MVLMLGVLPNINTILIISSREIQTGVARRIGQAFRQ